MKYTFADLVDLERVSGILEDFYVMTGIPPSIADVEGNVLILTAEQRICGEFHRKHPETLKRCIQSDTQLSCRILEDKGYACYECHNGLIDAAVPIVIDGEHVANLFAGQFLFEMPDRSVFRERALKYGFDPDQYMEALDEVPVFERCKVEKAMKFLAEMAELIGETALSRKLSETMNLELERRVEERTASLRKEVEERERAESEALKSLSEFEVIFNNSSIGIVLIREGRTIQRVNDRFREMFGYSGKEPEGEDLRIVFPSGKDLAEFEKDTLQKVFHGLTVQTECTMSKKDGTSIFCSLYGRAVAPPYAEKGIIWVVDDITRRKELDHLRSDVERIMRHDLKAPLSGIVSLPQTMVRDENLTEDQRETLDLVIQAGRRMRRQIDHSLVLFHIEKGDYEYVPDEVDIVELLRSLLGELRQKSMDLGVEVLTMVGPHGLDNAPQVLVQGRELLCYAMFSNLLDNALEASPAGGEVRIDVAERDGMCLVSIHNRKAVPELIRSIFFEKYVTEGKFHGTGLGTYIARLMAVTQGGTVMLSTSEEEGTTVTASLPSGGPVECAAAPGNKGGVKQ